MGCWRRVARPAAQRPHIAAVDECPRRPSLTGAGGRVPRPIGGMSARCIEVRISVHRLSVRAISRRLTVGAFQSIGCVKGGPIMPADLN
jgi:hypothetical protein